MSLAILSGGSGWHVQDLLRAAQAVSCEAVAVDFRSLSIAAPNPSRRTSALDGFRNVIVRTMPAGSLEQIVLRMDILAAASDNGVSVVNPPRSLEVCVDKLLTNVRLVRAGLPVPRTVACQRADEAMPAFHALGGDVVVKPLFGAEGRGIVRITDVELAWRTFRTLESTSSVMYIQQTIQHPGWDARAFVIAGRVVAAMKRTAAGDWRTNIAQGGVATAMELAAPEVALALDAAQATGCVIAGVDLIQNQRGEWFVLEVNAVPGWRALAEVCNIDIAAAVLRTALEHRP